MPDLIRELSVIVEESGIVGGILAVVFFGVMGFIFYAAANANSKGKK